MRIQSKTSEMRGICSDIKSSVSRDILHRKDSCNDICAVQVLFAQAATLTSPSLKIKLLLQVPIFSASFLDHF